MKITDNEEIHDLYSSSNSVRVVTLSIAISMEYAARAREIVDLYKILSGRPERKRLTRKPKHRCEDNIKCILA